MCGAQATLLSKLCGYKTVITPIFGPWKAGVKIFFYCFFAVLLPHLGKYAHHTNMWHLEVVSFVTFCFLRPFLVLFLWLELASSNEKYASSFHCQ